MVVKSVTQHTIRFRRITALLDLRGEGIEYGPLHQRLLDKADYRVRFVDFADRETLVQKYQKNPNVDTRLIPEIDIVTGGQAISRVLPNGSVDYVIASHVMEHVPNLVGWIEDNLTVLRPGGRIAVAFPDKRYTFDIKRRSSSLGDLLAAYFENRDKPNMTQLCDHFLNVAKVTPADAWAGRTTRDNAEHVHETAKVIPLLRQLSGQNGYVDCHCWVFEDAEALELLQEIPIILGLQYEVVSFLPTPRGSNEFYFVLEKKV